MIEATSKNFNELLENDLPVLVDFWAEWCGPCRMVAPILEELSTEYASVFITAKLNSDENPKTVLDYEIRSIPTIMLFKNGIEVTRLMGAKPKPAILAWIGAYLDIDAKIV